MEINIKNKSDGITYRFALRSAQDSRRSPEQRRGKLILDIKDVKYLIRTATYVASSYSPHKLRTH